MTPKQRTQFNFMLAMLQRIGKQYQTIKQLRKNHDKDYGLDYEECLEMSYENIQEDAKRAIKGVKRINP